MTFWRDLPAAKKLIRSSELNFSFWCQDLFASRNNYCVWEELRCQEFYSLGMIYSVGMIYSLTRQLNWKEKNSCPQWDESCTSVWEVRAWIFPSVLMGCWSFLFLCTMSSALPWSAVMSHRPPCLSTTSKSSFTHLSTSVHAEAVASRSPVWPTMSANTTPQSRHAKLPLILHYGIVGVSYHAGLILCLFKYNLWHGQVPYVAPTSLVCLIILSVHTSAWEGQSEKEQVEIGYKDHLPRDKLRVPAFWLASRHAHIRVSSVYKCNWSLPRCFLSTPMWDICAYKVLIGLKRSSVFHVLQIITLTVDFLRST